MMTALAVLLPLPRHMAHAQPLPTNGNVVAGQAAISRPDGSTLHVDQGSQRAVIDWNTFNIGQGNTVRFNQPNAQAQALNRVTGGVPSNIQGSLLANGQVLIQNANGVLFGRGAVVNVGSLLATTKAIDASAFMAGHPLTLSATGQQAGIINEGQINAAGFVTLMGDQVRNTGSISTAPGGQVILAAGDGATVALPNGQGVSVTLTDATANALVENAGNIHAQDGTVLLTARGKDTLLKAVVNLSGVVRAGTVVTDAARTGDIVMSATLDVPNSLAGDQRGAVVLSSDHSGLINNARAAATGDAAGGSDSSDPGMVAALVGAVGIGGAIAYFWNDLQPPSWLLDAPRPLSIELGDAAYWSRAELAAVKVDAARKVADVRVVTKAGKLERRMRLRDGVDGVQRYTFEHSAMATRADLSIDTRTNAFFYTESGVAEGKPYVVKAQGWLTPYGPPAEQSTTPATDIEI
ncbi:two-partner secretion domain-containing protein [Cupriavidus agavae]|nr:filamentous hemagglutinin N-terminal domain-containing protein [Cupriavidus agavae]